MPYVLMYQARSQQRWYWTIDQRFTSKENREFVIWESLTGLHHDFDNLKQVYPTRFQSKRPDCFFHEGLTTNKAGFNFIESCFMY